VANQTWAEDRQQDLFELRKQWVELRQHIHDQAAHEMDVPLSEEAEEQLWTVLAQIGNRLARLDAVLDNIAQDIKDALALAGAHAKWRQ